MSKYTHKYVCINPYSCPTPSVHFSILFNKRLMYLYVDPTLKWKQLLSSTFSECIINVRDHSFI